MINLAGNNDCDKIIISELERACIPVSFEFAPLNSEVHYSKVGYLADGKIKFTRAWTYWVVEGKIPAEVARKLYDHPEGRISVRVDGHCESYSPDKHAIKWFDNATDKIVVPQKEYSDALNRFGYSKGFIEGWEKEFTPDIGQPKTQYATLYHIDEQAGLLLFSMLINEYYNERAN